MPLDRSARDHVREPMRSVGIWLVCAACRDAALRGSEGNPTTPPSSVAHRRSDALARDNGRVAEHHSRAFNVARNTGCMTVARPVRGNGGCMLTHQDAAPPTCKSGVRASVIACVVLLCSGSTALAQSPTGPRLAWDQDAPDLATAQRYQYMIAIDGGTPQGLTDVTCAGAASPFTCAVPLPALAPDVHSLTIATAALVNGVLLTSLPSTPLHVSAQKPEGASTQPAIHKEGDRRH
jgi:hypothetical protein